MTHLKFSPKAPKYIEPALNVAMAAYSFCMGENFWSFWKQG
jgi:hypothetical protein